MSSLFSWQLLQSLLLISALIGINALLVAGEFALIQLNFGRLAGSEREELPRSISILLEDMNQSLRVIRLGIGLSTIALGFALVTPLSLAAEALDLQKINGMLLLGAFFTTVCIHFLVGELAPRALALSHPMRVLRLAVPLILPLRILLGPFVKMLVRILERVFKAMKLDVEMETDLIDAEVQIRSLLGSGQSAPPIMEMILRNTINLRKRVAQDILLPRNRIQFLDLLDSNETNLAIARESGHTRFPLCEGNPDHCIGLVHIKDIFRFRGDWRDIDLRKMRRDIMRFSLDDRLDVILQRLLRQRRHMALIQDEFGGTVGIVTLEDVLEELVGEIQDEFDWEEELIKLLPDGEYVVDGLAPIHDVAEELGVEIEDPEVSTFGGYITSSLGRMPVKETSFISGRLQIRVTGVNEKRVTSARVRVLPEADESQE